MSDRTTRAQVLPLDQAIVEYVVVPSRVTGVPLLDPRSLAALRRVCVTCGAVRVFGKPCDRCAAQEQAGKVPV